LQENRTLDAGIFMNFDLWREGFALATSSGGVDLPSYSTHRNTEPDGPGGVLRLKEDFIK
jgi:hypothetical protein